MIENLFDQLKMKILRVVEGNLTNYEVKELLKERKQHRISKIKSIDYAGRNWLHYKLIKSLDKHIPKTVSDTNIYTFLHDIEREHFNLTSYEVLQLINHIPTEIVDYHLLIIDCSNRFDEAQVEILRNIVLNTLGKTHKQSENQSEELIQAFDGLEHV